MHLVVGYPPGGVTDITARLIAPWLSERLGQQFVVENRPGASSNIATEAVARALPDGYTLLLISSSNAANVTLYDKLNFDFLRDIVPVASIGRDAFVMVVNPSFPAKTVPEFVAYAKANPGKINMATSGSGSGSDLYGQLFKAMAGIDLFTVHYRGVGLALPDLMAGRVQVIFLPVATAIGSLKAGTLRPLGVTSTTRRDVLPDVPLSASLCQVTRRAIGRGSAPPRIHRRRSSRSSTSRLMLPLRSGIQSEARRFGRRAVCKLARRVQQVHRRVYRAVEQGDPSGQYQAGVIFTRPTFHNRR